MKIVIQNECTLYIKMGPLQNVFIIKRVYYKMGLSQNKFIAKCVL